jgi:hypothetical protein
MRAVRLAPGAKVPVRRPTPKINRLSGEKGTVSGETLSQNSLVVVPLPPKYVSFNSESLSLLSIFAEDKSISRSNPALAYGIFAFCFLSMEGSTG